MNGLVLVVKSYACRPRAADPHFNVVVLLDNIGDHGEEAHVEMHEHIGVVSVHRESWPSEPKRESVRRELCCLCLAIEAARAAAKLRYSFLFGRLVFMAHVAGDDFGERLQKSCP
jgi:hypothetical protein